MIIPSVKELSLGIFSGIVIEVIYVYICFFRLIVTNLYSAPLPSQKHGYYTTWRYGDDNAVILFTSCDSIITIKTIYPLLKQR